MINWFENRCAPAVLQALEEAAPQLRQDREARRLAPTGPVRNRTGKGFYRVISGSKLDQVFGRLCWAFHVQRSLANLTDQDWVMKHSMPGSLGSLAQFQRLGSSATWAACCRPWRPSDLLPSPNRMAAATAVSSGLLQKNSSETETLFSQQCGAVACASSLLPNYLTWLCPKHSKSGLDQVTCSNHLKPFWGHQSTDFLFFWIW